MRRLFKNMSVYGLGSVITKSINFLLVPLYTRVLAPADYGTLELVYMTASLMSIFFGFMISSGFFRNYFDYKQASERQILLGSAFWFIFFNAILFGAILLAAADRIALAVFKFENGALFIRLVAISTIMQAHSAVLYNLLQAKEEAKRYVSIKTGTLLVTVLFNIIFLVFLHLGVRGVLYAQIVGYSLEFGILALLLLRKTAFVFSLEAVKGMLCFSLPLIPIQLSFFILNLSDRFFLQSYKTLGDVGLYALGYKFASIIPLFAIQPLNAFGPYIFSLADNPERCKKVFADFTRYYIAGVLLLALFLSMYSKEATLIIATRDYLNSWKVVFLLCLSYVFYGIENVISYAFHIVKKTWLFIFTWLFAAVSNIAFNILLIPRYGIIGAALATVFSYFILIYIELALIQRVYPIPFEYRKFFKILAATLSIYYLSAQINLTFVFSILLKGAVFFTFLFLLIKTDYFNSEERSRLGKIAVRIFHYTGRRNGCR